MNDKIRIAHVIPGGFVDGVAYHRLHIPHINLAEDARFDITQTNGVGIEHPKSYEDFDIVVTNRNMGGFPEKVAEACKKSNTKIVLDMDDYWLLPPDHLLTGRYKAKGTSQYMLRCIRLADHVTTTHDYFADVIRKHNPNVTVIPNAIDPKQPQNALNAYEREEATRIGWIGGLHHHKDLLLLKESFEAIYSDQTLNGKYSIHLGGWNPQYEHFERIFTANYHPNAHVHYGRINALDVHSYMQMYELLDVCLAPLVDNEFNRCKSQLKLIEAGYKKKAVICSDIAPYLVDGVNGKNCLMVHESGKRTWYKKMKQLINSVQMQEDLAGALHDVVMKKYLIQHANAKRAELYDSLIRIQR